MKKILIIFPLILVVLVISYILISKKSPGVISNGGNVIIDEIQPPVTPDAQEVDYKASFEIYTNGIKRDFSAAMYHNLSQDVFIDSSDPGTVQVKKSGITWEHFFNSLPMRLNARCLITGTNEQLCSEGDKKLRFFINDEENPEALNRVIDEGDKFVATFGSS